MARATGIGGVFFRTADPVGIKTWYTTHLGIEVGGAGFQEAGPMVVAPFEQNTEGNPIEFWQPPAST